MSVTYEGLRGAVLRTAAAEAIPVATAAMRTMTFGTMAMAQDLPPVLHPALVAAMERWLGGAGEGPELTEHCVAAWVFNETKNGNSTTIADQTDIAVRALICILWEEALVDDQSWDTLEFFTSLAERYGGLERILG